MGGVDVVLVPSRLWLLWGKRIYQFGWSALILGSTYLILNLRNLVLLAIVCKNNHQLCSWESVDCTPGCYSVHSERYQWWFSAVLPLQSFLLLPSGQSEVTGCVRSMWDFGIYLFIFFKDLSQKDVPVQIFFDNLLPVFMFCQFHIHLWTASWDYTILLESLEWKCVNSS